ncbi:uncharacterized protein LOC110240811 [Exaiptasia diaphana]|uniref:Uncharacterized protein n=1 Tax=Exaiptasia diaphana TaxID=2652724 RepID=A0A913XC75_EXADI|nr:uncharacterized protein LOC110240811 [Exaiptasia diaphana]
MQERVRKNEKKIKKEIDEKIDVKIAILEKMRAKLKQESTNLTATKMKRLSLQQDGLEMQLAGLTSAVEFTENILVKGSNNDVLSMKTQIESRLTELSDKEIDDEVDEEDKQILQVNEISYSDLENYVVIKDESAPDPKKCKVDSIPNTNNIVIEVRNCCNEKISIKTNRIQIKYPLPITCSKRIGKKGEFILNGSFQRHSVFTAAHQLEVLIDGHPINNAISLEESKEEEVVNTRPRTSTEKTERKLQNAAKEARTFAENVKKCIEKRRTTVALLRDFINCLNNGSEQVDVTSKVPEADGVQKQTGEDNANKLVKIQSCLDEDKDIMAIIDNKYTSLMADAEHVSQYGPNYGSKDQILCSLIVAATFSNSWVDEVNDNLTSTINVFTMVCSSFLKSSTHKEADDESETSTVSKCMGTEIVHRLAPKMKDVFNKGVVKTSELTVQSVLGKAAVDVPSAFDIYKIMDESQTSNVFECETSKILRDIEQGFREQLEKMDSFIAEIKSLAVNLEVVLKDALNNLLENISCTDEINDQQVEEWTQCLGALSWQHAVGELGESSKNYFLLIIAKAYNFLKPKFEEYEPTDSERREKIVDITFLAHGGVCQPLLPGRLHYLNNKKVKSILLYVPWGCMLDASAAYGIATGTITPENVAFKGLLDEGQRLMYWNKLPMGGTEIPNVVFKRVSIGEDAIQHLEQIDFLLRRSARGIFIPFLPERTNLEEIPLSALAVAVPIISWVLSGNGSDNSQDSNYAERDMKYRIHIASCLYPMDDNILDSSKDRLWPKVNCKQYWAVPVSHRLPTMTMPSVDNQTDLQPVFHEVNKYFSIRLN